MSSTTPEQSAAVADAPGELAELGRLGAPLVAAQMAQMGMGVLDTLMAGRVSAEDLAGVALGGNVIWPSMMLMMGVLLALTPTNARLHGAGRTAEIGEVTRQGVWLALLVAFGTLALVSQAERVYLLVGADPGIIPYATSYVGAAALGLPGLMLYFVLRNLCEGLGDTRPAMLVAFSALLLKALLNWIFVFGNLGAPAMGGLGCGWSTAVVMWFECFAMLLIVALPRYRLPTGLFERFSWPDPRRISELVRLGMPIGLTSFFEITAFSLVTLLVARFGAEAVAAQQIAFNVNGVMFMIPMGLGMAATIRIGHQLGAGRPLAARRAAGTAMGASVAFGVMAGAVLVLANDWIIGLYTRERAVAELGSTLLMFVAVYLIVDSAQATAIGCLRGYKDTRLPMLIALCGYWMLALPLGAALGFGWFTPALDVFGFWVGLASGLAFVALLLGLRLRRLTRIDR